eukprot:TRINITY_DN1341_c0_g3_i1.p1 TRINITY_DN1341_c0_g3~~TRINITY_DN1341_c0_g3_i1.p1  ORF type:complete len:866 (-),score=220.93 TRINITY_DN1341_c0_g3_i1:36-2633(-)
MATARGSRPTTAVRARSPVPAPATSIGIKAEDALAFQNCPDYSKINAQNYSGTRHDTFHTQRPLSGKKFFENPKAAGGEKRWGLVDNMSVQDLLWVCDQTFAKTARLLTQELRGSVEAQFEVSRASIRHDVQEPIKELTDRLCLTMDELPQDLQEPVRKALHAEVSGNLQSQSEAVSRIETDLAGRLEGLQQEMGLCQEGQQKTLELCKQILTSLDTGGEAQEARASKLRTSIMDGFVRETQSLLERVTEESQCLHASVENHFDALLWKHTKENPVKVDFREVMKELKNTSNFATGEMAELRREVGDVRSSVQEDLSLTKAMSQQLNDGDHLRGKGKRGHVLLSRGIPGQQGYEGSDDAGVQTVPPSTSDAWIQTMDKPRKKKQKIQSQFRITTSEEAGKATTMKDFKSKASDKNQAMFANEQTMKKQVREVLINKPAGVREYYHTTGWAQTIAKSNALETATSIMTLINILWIAVDADLNDAPVISEAHPVFFIVENIFCIYFSVEVMVRFCAFRRKRYCCRDTWFIFDSFVTFYMVLETWVAPIILAASPGNSVQSFVDPSSVRMIRIVKLFRLARLARLLRAVPELIIVIKAIGAAGRSMAVIGVFCLLLVYIFAVVFKQLFNVTEPGTAGFDTVLNSMNTLILQGIFADSAGLMTDLAQGHPLFWPLGLLFILLTSVTLLYMLIGVMVNVIELVASTERESMTVSYVANQLRNIMESLEFDCNAILEKSQMLELLAEPEAIRILYDVEVDVVLFVDMLDHILEEFMEKEGQGMNFADFIATVLDMRGTNAATVKDVKDSIRVLRTAVQEAARNSTDQLRNDLSQLKSEVKGHVEDLIKNEDDDYYPSDDEGQAEGEPPSPR